MMHLGVANEETWSFFTEIYASLQEHYAVDLFQRRAVNVPFFRERVNRRVFRRDMERFLQRNDVVFFEWASHLLAAASHMPKRCGIVTRLHRYEMYEWVDRINWENVDKVILVSRSKQREFVQRFPGCADKTVVASPSTSLAKFTLTEKAFSGALGTLCHLTPRKRIYDLVLSFSELCRERDDLHLHIAGGPQALYHDYWRALHHLVERLGLGQRVTFHGEVTDTPAWYRIVDIFISNSYSEGLQVAPMEAMASGCHVLSHRWEGAEELVPEDSLYDTGRELNQKILDYASLPAEEQRRSRARMRARACEHFDIDVTIRQIREIIEGVARQYGS